MPHSNATLCQSLRICEMNDTDKISLPSSSSSCHPLPEIPIFAKNPVAHRIKINNFHLCHLPGSPKKHHTDSLELAFSVPFTLYFPWWAALFPWKVWPGHLRSALIQIEVCFPRWHETIWILPKYNNNHFYSPLPATKLINWLKVSFDTTTKKHPSHLVGSRILYFSQVWWEINLLK